MKLKLQFTASVSNPPPDARPLSRKRDVALWDPVTCQLIFTSIGKLMFFYLFLLPSQVRTVHPAQQFGTCSTGTRQVWADPSPSPTSSHLDPTS